MPWTNEHKQETRQRILLAAAEAFRSHGAAGIGLADIMRRVGLTHGAFYAHFPSKEALLAASLADLHDARMARFDEMASASPDDALMNAARFYLSSRHREHPETGCAIATLGTELARAHGLARTQISANIRAWISRFAACAPARRADRKRRQATATFAAMIGGLIMARCMDDSNESDRILEDVRFFLDESLNEAPIRRPRDGANNAAKEIPNS